MPVEYSATVYVALQQRRFYICAMRHKHRDWGTDMIASDMASEDRILPARYAKAGRWLRDLRQYWQITQTELAEQAGAPDSAMIEWIEAGEIRLPAYMYPAFARAFGLDTQNFVDSCDIYYRAGVGGGVARSAA